MVSQGLCENKRCETCDMLSASTMETRGNRGGLEGTLNKGDSMSPSGGKIKSDPYFTPNTLFTPEG